MEPEIKDESHQLAAQAQLVALAGMGPKPSAKRQRLVRTGHFENHKIKAIPSKFFRSYLLETSEYQSAVVQHDETLKQASNLCIRKGPHVMP